MKFSAKIVNKYVEVNKSMLYRHINIKYQYLILGKNDENF